MSTPSSKQDLFDRLLDVYVGELTSMTDEEVLDGADPAAARAEGLNLLDAAKTEVGRRRLAAARASLDRHRNGETDSLAKPVSPQEARDYLKRAANDPRFTLAARGLEEMSDADALRLYAQLVRLVSLAADKGEKP